MTNTEPREAKAATEPGPGPAAAKTATGRPGTRTGGSGSRRVLWIGALGGTALIAPATAAELWFAPFVVGLALGGLTGRLRTRARGAVLSAAVAALCGWAIPLVWRAVAGEPVAAAARTVAALAGLPPSGGLIIAVTLLIAVVQGLLGVWVSRTLSALFTGRPRGG